MGSPKIVPTSAFSTTILPYPDILNLGSPSFSEVAESPQRAWSGVTMTRYSLSEPVLESSVAALSVRPVRWFRLKLSRVVRLDTVRHRQSAKADRIRRHDAPREHKLHRVLYGHVRLVQVVF